MKFASSVKFEVQVQVQLKSYFATQVLSAERDGLIEAGALSGSLDRRIGLDAVEMTNWLFTGSASYVHAGLILALHSSWRR